MTNCLLEARDICKTYGALKANDNVRLALQSGKIHALIGENGAGKSTLIGALCGVTQADSGRLLWRGKPIAINNPAQARRLGIGVVFQKFSLFEPLSVWENILLGVENRGDNKSLLADIDKIRRQYGLAIAPARRVADLATGEKQRVEIIRCLLQKPSLLIMDEPTSVLTPAETEGLFELLRKLAADGCAILFISHKLDEVEKLCEDITVLRRGKTVAQTSVAAVGRDEMTRLMVGEDVAPAGRRQPNKNSETLLQIEGLRLEGEPFPLRVEEFSLRRRVITGVAGIAGNGQELLQQCLSGEATCRAGAIQLQGEPIGAWGARRRCANGILTVPTDRYHTAAVGEMTLADNMLLSCARREKFIRRGWIDGAALRREAGKIVGQFNVAAPGADCLAGSLSGGNLQKFVVGRAVTQQPAALVVANPTWGVDVQAAAFIRRTICDLRDAGAAILLISEDLDELFAISDEIAVINGGALSAPIPVTETLTAAEIGAQMARG